MPAIINHKICDQSPACGGIDVCPVGAFTYNKKTKKIEIDNKKCISCGVCEKTCPIGAIGVAKNNEEYEELKQIIIEDPRDPADLFIDKYGADVINENVLIDFSELNRIISSSDNAVVEVFNDDSIMCLLKSIPYSEILQNCNISYYFRCNVGDNNLTSFNISELPSLIVCKNGKISKIISGYYEDSQKEKLFDIIKCK